MRFYIARFKTKTVDGNFYRRNKSFRTIAHLFGFFYFRKNYNKTNNEKTNNISALHYIWIFDGCNLMNSVHVQHILSELISIETVLSFSRIDKFSRQTNLYFNPYCVLYHMIC